MYFPWLKKAKRIIGRRLSSGNLCTEDALKLCEQALSLIRTQLPPPPTASKARTPDHSSCQELERFIGECYRSGSLSPEDALDLFDKLLPQGTPGSVYALNQLITVVARAPASSSSVDDGPSLAVSLYKRMARAGAKKVAPNQHTYGVVIGCFCQMGHLDLGFAILGQILKTGWRLRSTTFTHLLRALCGVGRTSDAMDIVLRRMPELGCTPTVFSFTTLLKGLCDEEKTQDALELLRMMSDEGSSCAPDVVSYTTVVDGFFKHGMVDNAMLIFRKMREQGLRPNVVSYGTLINGFCKAGQLDDAMLHFHQMIEEGLSPNLIIYRTLIHGFASCGVWEKAEQLFYEMLDRGIRPNEALFRAMMHNLRKEGRVMEAQNLFKLMECAVAKPDAV